MSITRLKYLAMYGNMHSARFLLALSESIWCVALLWPGDTFTRPTYNIMGNLMSEPLWALVFFFTALMQWQILLTGRYHAKYAVAFACWNMMLWWFVVISMYLSVYPPPAAISGELALAFGASWVFVRSGFPHQKGRRSDDV